MKFDLITKDPQSKARAGKITTDHGVIETPIFMPVGTVASVKGVHQRELKNDINPDIILGAQFYEGRGDTDYKRARDAKRFGKTGEKNTFGAGVAKGEKIEKAKLRRK